MTDERLAALQAALLRFGDLGGIVMNVRTNRLVGGHQRIKAFQADAGAKIELAKRLKAPDAQGTVAHGWVHANGTRYAYREVDWDEPTETAAMLSANKFSGDWEWDGVAKLLRELDTGGFENLALTGFHEHELERLLAPPLEDTRPEHIMDITPDLGGAKALKVDMGFESKAIYGIPELRMDMMAECPRPIAVWAGRDASVPCDHYLYNFGTDSVRGLDCSKAIIAFYTDDKRFEAAWENASDFTARLINRKAMAIVTPNYSLWDDLPKAIHIYNTYRARWCGRYWQEAGLKVIPDVNWLNFASFEFCLAGIPMGAPCLAIQLQTGSSSDEQLILRDQGALEIVRRLEPKSLLCYHGDQCQRILESLGKLTEVIPIQNRVSVRRKIMEEKGGETK